METMSRQKMHFNNLDLWISCISLIVLVSCTFMGVVMRYFFNDPFVWLQEVQLWCFTWVVFFGSGAAFRSGSHVAIEVVVDKMPLKMKKVVEVLVYFIFMAVLLFFFVNGSKLIIQLFKTARTTNILEVPYPVIYSAFPIGCVLMMVNHTVMVIKDLKIEKKKCEVVTSDGN